MQMIAIEEVKPGMVLAKPIRRQNDGLILLNHNIELKETYINKIKNLNLASIWVHDNQEYENAALFESIREEMRLKATTMLKNAFTHCRQNKTIDIVKLKELVKEILDYILSDQHIVYSISKINAYDHYTFTHSVDVCVLSVLIGSVMGLKHNELEVLGIGAMLHDIGKTYSDFRILSKPQKLEPEEYEQIKKHTRDGYNLLKQRGNVSFLVPHMALQHHEREDGSGYPRGLKGKRIHLYAKIIAVADVFDAMTSHRVYQKPVPPASAIQEILSCTPHKFDLSVVESFTKIVTPYTKGSILLLNNCQAVEVVSVSRIKCLVRVVSKAHYGETFNLYQKPELTVIQWLN